MSAQAATEPKHQMPFFYVKGKKPYRRIYDPSRSASYQHYLEDEKAGGEEIKKAFPLAASNPRALLMINQDMLAEMLVHRADANGDTVTDDPNVARRALNGNPKAELHEYSMKIPREKKERKEGQGPQS